MFARRMHMRIDHHPRLVGQHRHLVGRARAPTVLELEQPSLGFAHHYRLRLRALGQCRVGAIKPSPLG